MAVTLPSGWANFSSGCTECVDTTARGQADISVVTAFDVDTYANRASWGYIADGEAWVLGGNAFCGGGNMGYVSGDPALPLDCSSSRNVAMLHYTEDDATLLEALPVPVPPGENQSFINVHVGTSDRPVWSAGSNAYGSGAQSGQRVYYDIGTVRATYLFAANLDACQPTFAVSGDEFWNWALYTDAPKSRFLKYDRLAGGDAVATYGPFGNTDQVTVFNMALTTSYLYCFGSLAGVHRIYKINRSDGTLASSVITTALAGQAIAVASDNLIYLLCSGSPGKLYYLENFATLVYVGYATGFNFSPFSGGTAIWNNGNLYFGSTGFAGFNTDIERIEVACPGVDTDPLIASVTTDATVAAGAAINVSWANVLEPAASDVLEIRTEPAASTFGRAGTLIATSTANTTAAQSGTKSITIPGGTAAGNYVAMYIALGGSGNIWVATSAVFTVT